ncbi:hypothetical protein [Cohnella sp. GbtcB17]|uniref:hypothetical protein n=1 Tax=Cohnella sp. GbtcB17 TaxID=2824762 RepID=UPI001C300A9A|nr:hypothetical protein [Cohnella sp. GbtcB17]
MRLRITTAALLLSVSLAAAGCTNHDKNAESTASASPSPSATQTASESATASASGSPQATDAAPSASGTAPASSPAATAADADAPGFLISLPSGSDYKPFMQISEQNAEKVEAVLSGADWQKKESVAMSASPSYKLSALAGDKETEVYYVWTTDADAYELVKENGSEYAKLSKKDSASLAKLLPTA